MNGPAAKARRAWAISSSKTRAARWSARAPSPNSFRRSRAGRHGEAAKVKAGDALFFSADAKTDRAANLAGLARTRLGRELNLIKDDEYKFCWIVDFPMYEWNEDDKKIDFSHNPFSMPQFDREKFLALDPDDNDTILGIKAYQYDIVCNGYELSSRRHPQPRSRT